MTLGEQLAGAKIVERDSELSLTLAWFGGHGVHAYDDEGTEVSFWNTGSFANNDATEDQVRQSMENRIENGDYP